MTRYLASYFSLGKWVQLTSKLLQKYVKPLGKIYLFIAENVYNTDSLYV